MAYDGGIAFNFARALYAAELEHVHKQFSKTVSVIEARPLPRGSAAREEHRALHIRSGMRQRVRRSTDIDRLRPFAVHVGLISLASISAPASRSFAQLPRPRCPVARAGGRILPQGSLPPPGKVPVSIRSGGTR